MSVRLALPLTEGVGVSPEEPQTADTFPKCLLCILEIVGTTFREMVRGVLVG